MIGFEHHNHADCISTSVEAADNYCRTAGLQLTPARRRVLEILLGEHRALGAYDILEILAKNGFAAQPPVAYRALDFLVKHGFAHRIERLNAFVACAHPGIEHDPSFLLCRICDAVAEAQSDAASGRLGKVAETTGFKIERAVVEAVGVCPNCRGET
ncbi:MAG: transcriptional repressor [Silicimonas sp.]|jgi:Fur family zinc uptake transcriptional regulator|nr:transcriptional repressor [Silicimonas sp.]